MAYRWANQDGMSLDGLPYIGPYGRAGDCWYVAAGFNKWGMSLSMVAAGLLRNLLLGRPDPLAALFSPRRSLLRPQLAVNALEAAANLLRPTTPRCTHLGCALRWNRVESSWDCPCHGSRFDSQGHILNSPAQRELRIATKS